MDKYAAKKAVERASVRVAPGLSFKDPKELNIFEVLSSLGQDLVVKPIDQGSSVALDVLNGERELRETLQKKSETEVTPIVKDNPGIVQIVFFFFRSSRRGLQRK